MPKLKPLQEWICDRCGDVVDVQTGWVEWLDPADDRSRGPHSFRLVHHRARCQRSTQIDVSDNPIEQFLGPPGLQLFLSMLDVGALLDPAADHLPPRPEMRSFVDTVRRLHIPYYEEARQYFERARDEGYFLDNNEVAVFRPNTCKSIIERYEA